MSASRGGALPAALVLLLVLHVVALQAALTAATARLAVAHTAAAEEASRAAESAVLRAGAVPAADLQAALTAKTPLPLPGLAFFLPAGAGAEVRVRDDQEGDADPRRDRNGRLLLVARGWSRPPAAGAPAERTLVQEALVGQGTPLPAALLDCDDAAGLCGGTSGCPPPAARLDGGAEAAGMALPAWRVEGARQRLFVLARENLRRAAGACAPPATGCTGAADDLLRAAATDLIRALDDPAGDAVGLPMDGVLRLVDNLLSLAGAETGPGEVTWWDGSRRTVPERSLLVEVVEGLLRPDGHRPELDGHPLSRLLAGRDPWREDGGLCRRLPALQEAALRQAAPLPASPLDPAVPARVYLEAGDRVLAPGEVLEGRGLLVVAGSLEVPATATLRWSGVVLMSGGRLTGGGRVEVAGGVAVLAAPEGGQALDLMATSWQVAADPATAAAAWDNAGTVLLSRWEPLPGE